MDVLFVTSVFAWDLLSSFLTKSVKQDETALRDSISFSWFIWSRLFSKHPLSLSVKSVAWRLRQVIDTKIKINCFIIPPWWFL